MKGTQILAADIDTNELMVRNGRAYASAQVSVFDPEANASVIINVPAKTVFYILELLGIQGK